VIGDVIVFSVDAEEKRKCEVVVGAERNEEETGLVK
jgi:hypothetical protein